MTLQGPLPQSPGQKCCLSSRLPHCAPDPRGQGKTKSQLSNTETPANPGTRFTGQSHRLWASCGPGVPPREFPALLSAALWTDVAFLLYNGDLRILEVTSSTLHHMVGPGQVPVSLRPGSEGHTGHPWVWTPTLYQALSLLPHSIFVPLYKAALNVPPLQIKSLI